MIELLYFVLFIISALGFGLALFKILKINFDTNLEIISWAIPSGFGIIAVIGLELLFLQLIYTYVTFILLFIGLVLAILLRPRNIAKSFGKWTTVEKILFVIISIVSIGNFLMAITPEVRSDPREYHMLFAGLYKITHGFYENPWHFLSYMPIHVETLYTLALSIGRDHLAKMIHSSFEIYTALILFSFTRRNYSRKSGLWAAFYWIITPQVSWLSGTCFIDLALASWVTLSVLSVYEGIKNRNISFIILGGIYSGFYLGGKYTTGPIIFIPLLTALIYFHLRSNHRIKKTLFRTFAFSLPVTLITLPILIKNYIFTGNPFFPIFAGIIGEHNPNVEKIHNSVMNLAPPSEIFTITEFPKWVLLRWSGLNYSGTFLYNFALIAIITTLLFYIKIKSKIPFKISFFIFFSIGSWFMHLISCTNFDGRFLLPAFPVLCLLLGIWMCGSGWDFFLPPEKYKRARLLISWVIISASSLSYIYHHYQFVVIDLQESLLPIISESGRESYYLSHFSSYDLYKYINENLPEDAFIYSAGYSTNRKHVAHTANCNINPIEAFIGSNTYTSDQLKEAFQHLGYTHIIYPGPNTWDKNAVSGLIEDKVLIPIKKGDSGNILYKINLPQSHQ